MVVIDIETDTQSVYVITASVSAYAIGMRVRCPPAGHAAVCRVTFMFDTHICPHEHFVASIVRIDRYLLESDFIVKFV